MHHSLIRFEVSIIKAINNYIMKNFYKLFWLLLFVCGTITGQEQVGIIGANNWLRNWTEFSPKNTNYDESTHILAGNITEDLTLHKKNVYQLVGNVFITNGAILNIEPGTLILGDYKTNASLTITKGSKIIAKGLETDPIIFSSTLKKSGSWGGIKILGNAPTNKLGKSSISNLYYNIDISNMALTNFGGNDTSDDSGIFEYVRIEYAGKKFDRIISSNAIVLAGLGNKTEINNVMVSFSSGNALNVIGGNIDMHSMVSYKSKGNDFKFSFGAQSSIQNSLIVRSPYFSDRKGSKCILAISYDKNKEQEVDFSKNATNIFAKNITLLTDSKSLNTDIDMGLVKEAIYVGHNTELDISNSVISGFKAAVIIDEKTPINHENLSKIKLSNIHFNNCKGNVFVEFNSNNQKLESWYNNPNFYNVTANTPHSETFINITPSRPDYRLRSNTTLALNKK